MESNQPKTVAELHAMNEPPQGTFVQSGKRMVRIDSVQKLADEVYTINHQTEPLFTGFERIMSIGEADER